MDQQRDREHSERQLKASIALLAAGLLHVIGGSGKLHEVPRQIEEAARAIREHVDVGGALLTTIMQALNIEDAVVVAQRLRSLISSEDQERETIESLHEDALEAIRAGAVREVAATLEGNRIKRNRARQQVLFGINALIDARELHRELFGREGARAVH